MLLAFPDVPQTSCRVRNNVSQFAIGNLQQGNCNMKNLKDIKLIKIAMQTFFRTNEIHETNLQFLYDKSHFATSSYQLSMTRSCLFVKPLKKFLFSILSFPHIPIRVFVLHVLFLCNHFINNYTKISNASEEVQDMSVTNLFELATQLTFTCLKSPVETPEKVVKYVQS